MAKPWLGDTDWGGLLAPVWHWGRSKKWLILWQSNSWEIWYNWGLWAFACLFFLLPLCNTEGFKQRIILPFFCAVSTPEHHEPWTLPTATGCICAEAVPDALSLLHTQIHTNTYFTGYVTSWKTPFPLARIVRIVNFSAPFITINNKGRFLLSWQVWSRRCRCTRGHTNGTVTLTQRQQWVQWGHIRKQCKQQ